jgi:hypothetical protein
MNDCFYSCEYHYKHVMCHLFHKNALTFVKRINLTLNNKKLFSTNKAIARWLQYFLDGEDANRPALCICGGTGWEGRR